jgi:hypothetical protein
MKTLLGVMAVAFLGCSGALADPAPVTEAPWASRQGDGTWTLDRAVFRKLLDDEEARASLGRALLHRDGEAFDGYRLSGFRRGDRLHQAGLELGDVVHRIADVPVTAPTDGAKVLEALRTTEAFCVDLTRAEVRSTQCYRLGP